MSAISSPLTTTFYTNEEVNKKFLEMMPMIVRTATAAFAGYAREKRLEAVQSVLSWAFVLTKRLADLGKLDLCYGTPMAQFGIGRHREGRRVGTDSNGSDVSSPYCQNLGRSDVSNYDVPEGFIDPGSSDLGLKMDFTDWFQQQSPKDQQVINDFAEGNTLSEVARKWGVSPASVFQRRKRLAASWQKFIGEKEPTAA